MSRFPSDHPVEDLRDQRRPSRARIMRYLANRAACQTAALERRGPVMPDDERFRRRDEVAICAALAELVEAYVGVGEDIGDAIDDAYDDALDAPEVKAG